MNKYINVMKLNAILEGLTEEHIPDIDIKEVVTDSRKVKPGSLFIAYKGVHIDSHDLINQAIQNGAVAIIGERELDLLVPYFKVENGRLAWAQIISNWYGNPEKKLKIIGVTGTDGKTTTTNLIYQILKAAGKRVSMTSTINAVIGDRKLDTGLHTSSLDPDKLWPILAEMVEDGSEYAVLEATSHGLAQFRFGNIEFTVGVLTNLAHDHLEFHKSIEEYATAKAKLFARSKFSILNIKTDRLDLFEKLASGKIIIYDTSRSISGNKYQISNDQLVQKFKIHLNDGQINISTKLLGDYNIENILAAAKATEALGIDIKSIKKGIESLIGLKGRLEVIPNNRDITIIVDFAHTEQGLRNVLSLANAHLRKKGQQIISVFGCNGERDRTKRAPMGEAACKLSDLVVVTTEDPRTEDVNQIFEDIQIGCRKTGAELDKIYFRIDDRRQAIDFAINKLAKKGDFVLCLGKGHEESMNISGVETPWNEREVIEQVLGHPRNL